MWYNTNNLLPENNKYVFIHLNIDNWHDSDDQIHVFFRVAKFVMGITKEERLINNIKVISSADEWGNNKKPYCWKEFGPSTHFGQNVDYWMEIPELLKG